MPTRRSFLAGGLAAAAAGCMRPMLDKLDPFFDHPARQFGICS